MNIFILCASGGRTDLVLGVSLRSEHSFPQCNGLHRMAFPPFFSLHSSPQALDHSGSAIKGAELRWYPMDICCV